MISKDLSCGSSNRSDTRDKSDRCRCRNWVHWWSVDRGTGSGVSQWVKVDGQCQTQDQGQPVGESGLAMSDSGSVSASGQKWTGSVPVPVSHPFNVNWEISARWLDKRFDNGRNCVQLGKIGTVP